MKQLTKETIDASSRYIMNNARYLEKVLFGYYFNSENPEKVIKALKMYQNKDGGYGNGLEPDFRLPNSSPMATSVALQILNRFDDHSDAQDQIELAIRYLESTYLKEILGWEPTSKHVNLYPHAPWWKYTNISQGINLNPSVEILGYLIRYKKYVHSIDISLLTDLYIEQINRANQIEEHELYCIIRFYNQLDTMNQLKIVERMKRAYSELVNVNIDEWGGYVPYPLKFIELTEDDLFDLPEHLLNENLNYLVDLLNQHGYIPPTWSWGSFEKEWEIAKREWTGILTLKHLQLLKKYNRCSNCL